MADRYPYAGAAATRDSHSGGRSSESDPLAELARLIGQTDPNAFPQAQRPVVAAPVEDRYQHQEQYETEVAEPAPPSWMRATAGTGWQEPAAPTMHPVAHEQGYDQHEEQDPQYSDTPAFLRTARQHDQSRYDDVLYDQNSQNQQQYPDRQYQDGDQDQSDPNAYQPFYADDPQDEPARKRGGLMTVAAVLVLAVVGTAAAYGYRSYTGAPRSGEPPVIKAEQGGTKIVPPTQTSDASGKIVDRIGAGAGGQERVLSREEQPIDINGRNAPRVVFPPLNQSGNPPAVATTTQTPAAQQQVAANGALSDEPRRVRTMTIRPDQPDAVPSGSAPPPRPTTSARAQANGPISLSPQASPAPATAPVRTAAAPAAAPAASSGGTGGYMVQISSQRSEADAQASYRAMQSKFPNVLGSRSASIRRADLGDKGIYYRALVGPFGVAEEAGQLCNSLKSAGGQCVVQRN
jgi:hypothetical protein